MPTEQWPLIGRDVDRRAIDLALAGDGGVVLAGAAGVGKSRLARDALDRVRGATPVWLVGSASAREVPLGAFASLLGGVSGADTTRPTSDEPLVRAAAALRRQGLPPVLVVDDAHLLDPVSATLLHQLGADRLARLVLTVRSGERPPDAVTALWKDGLVERHEVAALDESDTGTLLAAVLGGPVDPLTRSRLFAVTRGNVLWLRHLVDDERAAGRIAPRGGVWTWNGDPEISPALRDLVDARIGQLSEPSRRLLELLAFGEPLGAELLSTLVGPGTVEDAADRGLITVVPDGRRWDARLGHPLYGEAARSCIDPLRARRRRRELVAALQATGARRFGDTLRCAVLALDSDLPVTADRVTAAGAEAAALTDLAMAERLFRAAVDAGGGFEPQSALGYLLSYTMRADDAEVELSRAVAGAVTEAQWGEAMVHRLVNLYFVAARPADALFQLDEAEQACAPGRAREALRAVRSVFAAASNRLDAAVEAGSRVLDAPDASAQAVAWAGYALVGAHGMAGRTDRLSEIGRRSIAAALSTSGTAVLQFNIRYFQLVGLGLAGHVGPAQDLLPDQRDVSGPIAAMTRDALGARVALDSGRVGAAARAFQDLRAFFPGYGGGWTGVFEAGLAQARGMGGDAAGAREALGRAEEFRHPGMDAFEPDLMLGRAWAAAAEGGVSVAIEWARRAAELAGRSGQRAVEVVARHTAVCLGDDEQAARLTELAAEVDGPRAPAAAAHAAAWAARDAAALLVASGELERCGLLLPAADAAAQAAALHRARDRFAAAVSVSARAGELARRCDGARTPALTLAASRLPISAREREVATLAGSGRPNREIADRLHVSVRTVEGHVYRACGRLGVADRAALAELVTAEFHADGV